MDTWESESLDLSPANYKMRLKCDLVSGMLLETFSFIRRHPSWKIIGKKNVLQVLFTQLSPVFLQIQQELNVKKKIT